MNRADRDALHVLLSAVVDGTASEEQVAELARRLESDAEMRTFYVQYLDMHAVLQGGQLPRPAVRPRRSPWLALVVSSLMAASLLFAWLVMPPPSRDGRGDFAAPTEVGPSDAAPIAYVATVTAASEGAILDGDPVRVGMRLSSAPYCLMVGRMSIRFDGGASVLIEDASRFTIHSRRAMQIDAGTMVFEGDQTCESIEVTSPHSVFKNIGTRYAAVINAQGEELHVAEGAVRRTVGDAGEPSRHELVEAGTGRRYVGLASEATSIPLDQSLVSRSLDDAQAASRVGPSVTDGFRGGASRLRGLNSGTGWSGPWESRKDSLRLASPGLSGVGSVAVIHDAAGKPVDERKVAAHRKLQTPIDLSQDGIWYLRFLVRRQPVASGEHRAMISLRTRGLTEAEELERNTLLQIALRRTDSALVRIADSFTRASIPQIPGQTYAVIAKIVAGRAQPDQVLVSLMAAERLAASTEPTEWSLVSESVDSDIRLDKLSLESTTNGEIAIGDICIGPTWSSIARPLDP